MWQVFGTRSTLTVARRGWLVVIMLAVIAAAGHMAATRHCQADAATPVEWTAVQPAGAGDALPQQTCCAHGVEVGQRTACTASGDVQVPTCGSAPRAQAAADETRAGRSVPRVLTQAQLQRWRH